MSLRLRLLASIAAILLASLGGGSVLVYWHALGKVETEVDAAVSVAARMARTALGEPPAADEPRQRLERLVSDFDGNRHVRAALLDPSGMIVAISKVPAPDHPAPAWFHDLLAGDRKMARLLLPGEYARHGSIVIETDAANELGEAWSDIKLALTVLTLFCVLVLLLLYWTLGRALRPLEGLVQAFGRVGEGDYGVRVAERVPAEFAYLYRGFNRMTERLTESERQNRRLQEQLAAVQEEERADLARDLHDEIGPFLFAVDVDAATIQKSLARGGRKDIPPRLAAIREAVAHMQRHVRGILGRLRSGLALDLGLAHVVDDLVRFWRTRRPEIAFDVKVAAEGFGPAFDSTILRVVQEGVSNAVRHARPSRISIRVGVHEGTIIVTVSDDGAGLAQGNGGRTGYGLVGMRERVSALGGTLTVGRREEGSGVIVCARLPLSAVPAQASAA